MYNRIRRRLRSRRGASITFGLLLFLVCAVLCSVILTAATAASGRMSKISETDQRYYAVTSAAELLKVLVDQRSVTVVEVTETRYSRTVSGPTVGPLVKGPSVTRTYLVPDKKGEELTASDLSADNLLESASFVNNSLLKDAAMRCHGGTTLTDRALRLSSSFYQRAGLDYDALAVTILESLDAEGNLTLRLYNRYSGENTLSAPGTRFTLTLRFEADPSVSQGRRSTHTSSIALDEDNYLEETLTTVTTVTTLTWGLTGMTTTS